MVVEMYAETYLHDYIHQTSLALLLAGETYGAG
jgi:hypothetical protein